MGKLLVFLVNRKLVCFVEEFVKRVVIIFAMVDVVIVK